MKIQVFYTVFGFDDSIILEAETTDELTEKIKTELGSRGAEFRYIIRLQD